MYLFVSIVIWIFKYVVLSEHFCFVLLTLAYTIRTFKHVSDKCQSHRNLPCSALHYHSAVSIPHVRFALTTELFPFYIFVCTLCAFPGCLKITPCNFNSTCLCSNRVLWELLGVCNGKNDRSEDICDGGRYIECLLNDVSYTG